MKINVCDLCLTKAVPVLTPTRRYFRWSGQRGTKLFACKACQPEGKKISWEQALRIVLDCETLASRMQAEESVALSAIEVQFSDNLLETAPQPRKGIPR